MLGLLGWLGTLFVCMAYFLTTSMTIKVNSFAYCWMNVVGSILLGTTAAYSGIGSIVILNVFWVWITLANYMKGQEQKRLNQNSVE